VGIGGKAAAVEEKEGEGTGRDKNARMGKRTLRKRM